MPQPYLGPTAQEAAEAAVRQLARQIRELTDRKRWAAHRAEKYRGSALLESERVATEAEPYQAKQLV